MGFVGGAALRLIQTVLYGLAFCCSAIILGFYSYFLAIKADRDATIPTWQKAVEGLSGAAVLYTIFAVVLTCCLGGIRFFAFLAILLDVLFCGAFIALAVLTRDGASSCSGNVRSPLGDGPADSKDAFGADGFGSRSGENVTYSVSLGTACRYNTACFAVAIIGAFLFLIAALFQVWLARNAQREKRFGPSPANNYTTGSGKKWFGRRKRGVATTHHHKDAEAGAIGAGGLAAAHHHHDAATRPSHDTAFTGTTAGHHDGTYTGTKYEQSHVPTAGGYHTAPTGTGVNPYGYDNTTRPVVPATNY